MFLLMFAVVHYILPAMGVDTTRLPAVKTNSYVIVGGVLLYWLLFTNMNSSKPIMPSLKQSWKYVVGLDMTAALVAHRMLQETRGEDVTSQAPSPTKPQPKAAPDAVNTDNTPPNIVSNNLPAVVQTPPEDTPKLLSNETDSRESYLPGGDAASTSALGNTFTTTVQTSNEPTANT